MPKVESSRRRERFDRGFRGDSPRGEVRSSDRGPNRYNRESSRGYSKGRPEIKMTKVVCDSCKNECEVPFKPNSNKPVYCRDCFAKNGGGRSNAQPNRSSSPNNSKEFEAINEKLDKIMTALKIE